MTHPAGSDEQPDWYAAAACLGAINPNDWFGEHGSDTDRALATCDRCPVHVDCLTHALVADETVGIWGGKTPEELRDIRREARRRSRDATRP
jgi:WhiB family redox-sensing transcriptional regulator